MKLIKEILLLLDELRFGKRFSEERADTTCEECDEEAPDGTELSAADDAFADSERVAMKPESGAPLLRCKLGVPPFDDKDNWIAEVWHSVGVLQDTISKKVRSCHLVCTLLSCADGVA